MIAENIQKNGKKYSFILPEQALFFITAHEAFQIFNSQFFLLICNLLQFVSKKNIFRILN